jgi:hypothetical protein
MRGRTPPPPFCLFLSNLSLIYEGAFGQPKIDDIVLTWTPAWEGQSLFICANPCLWQLQGNFFYLPLVSITLVVQLELQISLRIFEKILKMALMGYTGAWGKLIHEQNLKSKILFHCPFKYRASKSLRSYITCEGYDSVKKGRFQCLLL